MSIKPPESIERLGTVKQFLKRQCYKGGDGKHPVKIKADGTKRLRTPGKSPGEEKLPEEQGSPMKHQASAPEEAKHSNGGLQALQ